MTHTREPRNRNTVDVVSYPKILTILYFIVERKETLISVDDKSTKISRSNNRASMYVIEPRR
jgi:hypothetical protein